MVLEHTDYRAFLKNVLIERQRKNPSYSMRAFAQFLGITQAAVSQVLSGKKNLSSETALQVASKLRLGAAETEYFCLLVQLSAAKRPLAKESILNKLNSLNPQRPVRELSVDYFRSISDWYHLVIRNMTEIEGVDFSPKAIAARLGITPLEAEAAIERLCRLELIEKDPEREGRYRKTADYVLTQSAVPNEALRAFHRQMMEKAVESLTTQTPREKVVGSETFAIDTGCLEEARRITEEYFQKMLALSRNPSKKTQVFHLGVQFFNVTRGRT
jgi:uncharacterized protein (TIGR02147 family)